MIKKMTVRKWISAGALTLFCLGGGGFLLWKYGFAAYLGLRGFIPRLSATESMDNIYLGAGLGLAFVVLGLIIVIRQLRLGVGKQVKSFLANHPEVTMEELESDFAAARQYKDIWIGSRFTFSYSIVGIVVENAKIAWVFNEVDGGRHVQYFLCLGTADGKIIKTSVDGGHLRSMKEQYAKYPHILLDNSDEYEPLFKNNLKAFLDIKYNRNVHEKS